MKKIFKTTLALFLAFVMIFGAAPLSEFVGLKLPDWLSFGKVNASAADYQTGDIITFGSYPQTKVTDSSLIAALNAQTLGADSTVTYGGNRYKRVYFTQYTPTLTTGSPSASNSYQDDNGYYINTVYWFKYEPIQWRVLSNTNGELFVMAKKILASRAYNQVYTNVTWETCTMRSWLNSEFYNEAFNATQRAQIKTSTVVNEDNPWHGTDGGSNTADKLFLLSYSEVMNPAYGFSLNHSIDDVARRAQGTDFAKSNGLWVNTDSDYFGNSNWWLRSPGSDQDYAGYVNKIGYVYIDYTYVCSTSIGARPALKLNLSSGIFTSETVNQPTANGAFLWLYDKDNETPLRNKAITINGTDYTTTAQGTVILSGDITQPTVSISAANYYTYRFDTEIICGPNVCVVKTVYLERLKESTKPYISSVHYKNVTANTGWKDAIIDKIEIPENSSELFDIKIHALPRSSPVAKIVLSQDGAYKLESANGVFSGRKLADVFVKNKDIYAYCIAADGTVSKAVKIKIVIGQGVKWYDTENAFQFEDIKLFDDVSVTIPDSIPLINGENIGLEIGAYRVSIKREGNRFKAAIGAEVDKKYYESDDKLFDSDEWNLFKSAVNDIKKGAGKLSDFKGFKAKTADSKFFANRKISAELCGYIEYEYVNGSPVVIDIGGYLKADGNVSKAFYFPCAFPVYIDVTLGVEVKVQVGGARVLADTTLPFELNVNIDADIPYLEVGFAAGMKGVLSAGGYGKGAFHTNIKFFDRYCEFSFTGKASIKAQALILKYEYEIWNDTYSIWSGTWGNSKQAAAPLSPTTQSVYYPNLYDPSNYSEPAPRDYAAQTRWLGSKVSNATPNDIVIGNTETKTLQTSIYGDSRQQLVECDGKKVLFWITDNQSRAAENRTMLVYSVYNETNDTWSSPLPVDDDGTADFYPNAVTDGTNIYIAWQNSKTVFNASTATLENYAATGEISVAKYNPVTGISETNTVTNNTALDTMPVAACGGGAVKVVWVNNDANDIFGLTGTNSLCVSEFTGSTWSAPSVLKTNLTSVHSIDAAINAGKLYVAYAYDMDNDPQDTSDLEVFQVVQNGASITTSRLTNNAVLDSAPQYGKIDGGTKLIWYSEGNLTALSNLDSTETATLFAGATTVNDSFTIAQSGIDVNYIVWPQMVDGHVEFYATAFDGLAWSDPVELTSYNGKALYPSAVVEDDGTMFIGYNNVAQTLVTVPGEEGEEDFSYYEDGQTDLCMLKVFQNTDISVSDENLVVHCEDVVPNGTLPLALTVTNKSTVFVNSVDVFVDDTLIETVPVNLLPGESADITVDFSLPAAINYTEMSVKALPHGVADCDERDNAVTTAYGLKELSIGEMQVEDTALRKIISATVSNDSAVDSGSFTLRIHEDALDGEVLYEETYDNLTTGQALLINYSIDKSSVVYDEDGFKKYYFEIVSESEEYSKGNNSNVASFSAEGSEGVTSEVLNWSLHNNIATVFGVIENREFSPNSVYAKIEILDNAQNVIGCTLKRVTLAAKEVYTLEENVPFAGSYSEVRVTILLMDTGTNDIEITIPAGVTQIPANAFADCADLVKIIIPPSVAFIGEGVFTGCGALTIIGEKGSAAETYAAEENIPFIAPGLTLFKLPDKLQYNVGEAIDFTGMRLVFCGADYAVTEVTAYQVSGYDSGVVGTQTVTLAYGAETVSFAVTVRIVYPESDHPYTNSMNKTWTYSHPQPADSLEITFSADTQTESGYDYIYLYDSGGLQIGKYSGTALAGQTVTVPGNSFSIKLTSDGSVTKYGFRIVSIIGIGVDAIIPAAGSTCVIDNETGVIYGLEPGITQAQFENDYVSVISGYTLRYSSEAMGTGTVVNVVNDGTGEVVETYTIVIFGDVNGDSNINAIDTDICLLVQNWMIEWDETEDAAFLKAGDVNGDGRVDAVDADIISLHENWMVTIDQTTGLAS